MTPILEAGFDRRAKRMAKLIDRTGVYFEAIAFCGLSGSVISPLIAKRHECYLIGVRKKSDECHSDFVVEAPYELSHGSEYIIVDDQIDTGNTIKRIIHSIRRNARNEKSNGGIMPTCSGIFLYLEHERPPQKYPIQMFEAGNERIPIWALDKRTYEDWEVPKRKSGFSKNIICP